MIEAAWRYLPGFSRFSVGMPPALTILKASRVPVFRLSDGQWGMSGPRVAIRTIRPDTRRDKSPGEYQFEKPRLADPTESLPLDPQTANLPFGALSAKRLMDRITEGEKACDVRSEI
ncbi:protein of unknown function [Magnetospira sp. QH-2]|nr:protein of unknown function [Magnetospira sp. QH-2]